MKVINLLPEQEKKNLSKQNFLSGFRKFLFWSLLSYAAVLVILVAAKIYNQQSLAAIDQKIQDERTAISKQDSDALKKSIDQANANFIDYNSLAKQNPNWSRVLEEFSELV